MPIDRSLANTVISCWSLSWPSSACSNILPRRLNCSNHRDLFEVKMTPAIYTIKGIYSCPCSRISCHVHVGLFDRCVGPSTTCQGESFKHRWLRVLRVLFLRFTAPMGLRFQCQLVGGQNGYNSPGFVSVGFVVAGGLVISRGSVFSNKSDKIWGKKTIAGKIFFSSDLSERPKI